MHQRFANLGGYGNDVDLFVLKILSVEFYIATTTQDAVFFVGSFYDFLEIVVGYDGELVYMFLSCTLPSERQTKSPANGLFDERMSISSTQGNDGVEVANIPALAQHIDMHYNLYRVVQRFDG